LFRRGMRDGVGDEWWLGRMDGCWMDGMNEWRIMWIVKMPSTNSCGTSMASHSNCSLTFCVLLLFLLIPPFPSQSQSGIFVLITFAFDSLSFTHYITFSIRYLLKMPLLI
jgi:hypothetical protein